MATPKYKENFPLFDELARMIPEECREEVKQTMQQLENEWRDDLCKATIRWVTGGKRKAYKKSRVMRMMFAKVSDIIENSNNTSFAPLNNNVINGQLIINNE